MSFLSSDPLIVSVVHRQPFIKVLLKGFPVPNGFLLVMGITLKADNQNHF